MPESRAPFAAVHPPEATAHHIEIAIADGTARLMGSVTSWAKRRAIERAAREVPGVIRVDNQLEVPPDID